MNSRIVGLMIATAFALVLGCGSDNDDKGVKQAQVEAVPTVSQYRQVLERRSQSSGGADLDIRKLCAKFESASDSKKRELYKTACEFAR